jgi:hypothetical protein
LFLNDIITIKTSLETNNKNHLIDTSKHANRRYGSKVIKSIENELINEQKEEAKLKRIENKESTTDNKKQLPRRRYGHRIF